MKKILSTLIVLFILLQGGISFAQLGHSNMYLVKNLDEHQFGGNRLYSALWGYAAPDGREYAILGCNDGTAFIDVTDSASISEVGFVPTTDGTSPSNNWREMKTYSHYAYIVSEVDGSGIQIVDLQYLPDSVSYLGVYTPPGHESTHSISQSGPYLYLNGCNSSFGNGVTILDLTSDPTAPVVKGGYHADYIHDARILNDTIWASNIYDSKLTIINATDKSSLSMVTSWENFPNSGPHNSDITGDRKHVLVTDEIGGVPRLLKIWNIENLSNITHVTSWQPTGITTSVVHNVEIYGNYALIAHYSAGVRLLDITNPASPVEVAWYDTYPSNNNQNYAGCWGIYMLPSGKIIASDRQTGLYVLKTTFGITGLEVNTNLVPEKFTLNQNYPNPFNPATKINFALPESAFVTLKVFNLAGQEVATLANDKLSAGSYEYSFDAGKYSLSSGVYFYTLETPGFSDTKKMILLK